MKLFPGSRAGGFVRGGCDVSAREARFVTRLNWTRAETGLVRGGGETGFLGLLGLPGFRGQGFFFEWSSGKKYIVRV